MPSDDLDQMGLIDYLVVEFEAQKARVLGS
jgi:hypothetical protein